MPTLPLLLGRGVEDRSRLRLDLKWETVEKCCFMSVDNTSSITNVLGTS